jgi:hypothetical protein
MVQSQLRQTVYETLSWKNSSQKRAGRVAQGVGSKFKSQYWKKKKMGVPSGGRGLEITLTTEWAAGRRVLAVGGAHRGPHWGPEELLLQRWVPATLEERTRGQVKLGLGATHSSLPNLFKSSVKFHKCLFHSHVQGSVGSWAPYLVSPPGWCRLPWAQRLGLAYPTFI